MIYFMILFMITFTLKFASLQCVIPSLTIHPTQTNTLNLNVCPAPINQSPPQKHNLSPSTTTDFKPPITYKSTQPRRSEGAHNNNTLAMPINPTDTQDNIP